MTTVIHFPGMTTNTNQSQTAPHWQGRLRKGCFVGREQELAELRAGLEDILRGRGRVFLLAGEPGVGKTRTVRELAAYACCRGAQVYVGHCDESDSAPPYWPWVQLVRTYISDRGPQMLQAEMGPGAADIAQVMPAVHERVPGLPLPPVLEPQSARFRFFGSFAAFLKKAAKAQPLVLILDDLQRAAVRFSAWPR
jgi:predicted ATPase